MVCRRTKFRLFLYGSFATVLIVANAAAIVRLNPHGKITRANYDKIRPGMGIAEVEDILGARRTKGLPPMDYHNIHSDESAMWTSPLPVELRFWKENSHMISVIIDSQGKVVAKSYSRDPGAGVVRRMIDWLG